MPRRRERSRSDVRRLGLRAVLTDPRTTDPPDRRQRADDGVLAAWREDDVRPATDGDEVVSAHLANTYQKHRNLARDPRISIYVQLPTINDFGLQHYLVMEGTARLTPGGGSALLQRLAHVYLGPHVTYPGPEAPDGFVLRTTVTKVRGVFPWQNEARPGKRSMTGWRD